MPYDRAHAILVLDKLVGSTFYKLHLARMPEP